MAMDGRKQLVPSSGLCLQVSTERHIFDASQIGEGLVKELIMHFIFPPVFHFSPQLVAFFLTLVTFFPDPF